MCTLLEINQSIAAKFFMVNSPMFCWRISWIYFSEWTHNTNICHLICHNCLGYLNCGPSHPLDITCSSSLLFFSGENAQKILLVTIPDFSSTKTCVMLNLQSLTCHPVNFSASVSMQMEMWLCGSTSLELFLCADIDKERAKQPRISQYFY